MTENISLDDPFSNERRFQILVDAVVDYAIFMLDVEGRVSSWNTGAKRIKGYSADEIIGHHFSRFYTEADRAAGVPARALGTAADEGKYETEGWRLRKDGSRFWASVIIDPIRDQSGKLVGYAKVTRDITDRLKVQDALEQTRAAFVQSQKMEAVGQLTGGVAHDFNNLLTVITNALDLLSRPKIEEHQRNRIIETAQRAAARGAKLTQQLLAFSRRQPLRPQAHRLNELIRGFDAVLRRACGEAIELDLRFAARPLGVNVDGPQFEAALLNLTLNSRDAMPQGGKLRIATDLQTIDAARAAQMSGIKTGPYAVITVEDTGEGMPPETRARAFEPFFTTKEVGKGSGLGLSQVYGFVMQSGGHIEINSDIGVGTRISFFLPATMDAFEDDAAAADRRSIAAAAGTVLVVEDDPEVLEVAVETLRSLGYNVVTAADGPSALAKLQRRDRAIDVLFTDVVMPSGMSGIELARQARELLPHLQVLLASGYPMSALSADHGLTDEFMFLSKPYRWSDLSDRIRAIRGTP
ncbi:MAG TPA: PAS domain S-box protein [Alphaproteobacteria bacterium]